MTGYHETNYSMAYSSHISWQSSGFAGAGEVYPSLAWDNLFENRGSLRNMSILDRVKDRAEDAQPEDQLQRQEPSSTNTSPACAKWRSASTACARTRTRPTTSPSSATTPVFTMDRPANGLPEDLREHARLMCDIIAIAFQTDKTRVASLLSGPRPFGAVLSVPGGPRRPPCRVAQQQLRRLRAHRALPPEPTGLSGHQARQHAGRRRHGARQLLPDVPLEHVDRPQARQLPVAAGAGRRAWAARCKTGRTLNYLEAGDDNRKMCSLYLSIMDRMGVKLDQLRRRRDTAGRVMRIELARIAQDRLRPMVRAVIAATSVAVQSICQNIPLGDMLPIDSRLNLRRCKEDSADDTIARASACDLDLDVPAKIPHKVFARSKICSIACI